MSKHRNDRLFIPGDIQRKLDQLKRSILLEHDGQFQADYAALAANVHRGIVPAERLGVIRDWQVAACLRRNHVGRKEADRLMRA